MTTKVQLLIPFFVYFLPLLASIFPSKQLLHAIEWLQKWHIFLRAISKAVFSSDSFQRRAIH